MIVCKECGFAYDESMKQCPKCGNPTELSMGGNTCPNCGAEGKNVQGYNFVCEFCDTQFPVDAQTRAMIDAKQRQIFIAKQQEYNQIVQKKNKKMLIKIAIIFACFIAAVWGYNYYVSYEAKKEKKRLEQITKEEKEKIQQIKKDIVSCKSHSAYISPSDIFITKNPDRIGHLNQNLIATLKRKGFVEDGALTYSYYVNGKPTKSNDNNSYYDDYDYNNYDFDASKPLIKIVLNSYKPIVSRGERLNESDAINSVSIIISNKELREAYVVSFRKDLRNIGFKGDVADKYDYNSSITMSNFSLLRIGNIIKKTEFYLTKITANWEGVNLGNGYLSDYDNAIECVGFCEIGGNVTGASNNSKSANKSIEKGTGAVKNSKDPADEVNDAAREAIEAIDKAAADAEASFRSSYPGFK